MKINLNLIKLSIVFVLLLILGVGLWPNTSWSYFQDLGIGVRPVGMGESFVAVADDSNTLLWNASGLADLEKKEVNLMYASLFSGLEARLFTGGKDMLGYNNIAFALPIMPEIGSFGFGWTLFTSEFYQENTFIIGYGREVGKELFQWLQASERVKKIRLNAGMNIKILNWNVKENQFTQSNSVFNSDTLSNTNFTADISMLVHWIENVKFGLSLENIIPTDVGVTTYEPVPFNLRFGVSYLHKWDKTIPCFDSLLGTVEFTYRNDIYDIRVGAESWLWEHLIGIRMGTTADNFSSGISVNAILPETPVDVQLDYAFTYPYAVQSTFGSHRFSLIIRWGTLVNSRRRALTTNELQRLVEPDENVIAQREAELAKQREKEKLILEKELRDYREEIQKSQTALREIKEQIDLGQLPAIMFESGTSRMKKSSLRTLSEIGKILEKYPKAKCRIEGHTDAAGNDDYNLKLSQDRASAVADHLISMFKIKTENIIPVGYGETRPIASNKTVEGRKRNRRVEVKVILPEDYSQEETKKEIKEQSKSNREKLEYQDVVPAEEIKKTDDKSQVYELEMDSEEVEHMFEQQKSTDEQEQ